MLNSINPAMEIAQDVSVLVLRNEIDPWKFVQPFDSLDLLAVAELAAFACAGWMSPQWRNGVFVAAAVTPLSVVAHTSPLWTPLSFFAVSNAVHFAVVLAVYTVAFGIRRIAGRRMA